MVVGLKIDINGIANCFDYSIENYDNDRLDIYANERGIGQYELLESFEYGENKYLVFGWATGYNFNKFDLHNSNACGDIIIVRIDNEERLNPLDIYTNEIQRHYDGEDIMDDYIIEDINMDEDEYIFDDWCVEELSDWEMELLS